MYDAVKKITAKERSLITTYVQWEFVWKNATYIRGQELGRQSIHFLSFSHQLSISFLLA